MLLRARGGQAMAAFDWYQATIPAPVDDVLEACMGLAEGSWLVHSKGMQGYAHTTAIDSPQGLLGKVWHGGTHARPHAVFTGDQAEEGSKCIRASFPEHFVTRADPRMDFIDPTAYDRIEGVMASVARSSRIKVGMQGDHKVLKEGRTFELGAPTSAVRERLYEKTAEQMAKFAADPVRLATVPRDWVRLEAQIRPQTLAARAQFAAIEPVDAMGSSAWLRAVWLGVVGEKLAPVQVGKPWRQSDDDRAWAFLLAQYGGLLERKAAEHGSWECLGLQIGSDLVERRKAERESARTGLSVAYVLGGAGQPAQ